MNQLPYAGRQQSYHTHREQLSYNVHVVDLHYDQD